MWSRQRWVLLAVAVFLVVACGGNDDDDNGGDPEATATGAPAGDDSNDEPTGGGGDPTGTFTLGEDTWTFAASIQCGIFPGPVVAISGNAVEDAGVELVVDLDVENDLVEAAVSRGDENWTAENENVSIEVDGDTVSGEGTFREFISGATADGSFEITC
jgi:hypothetical protein